MGMDFTIYKQVQTNVENTEDELRSIVIPDSDKEILKNTNLKESVAYEYNVNEIFNKHFGEQENDNLFNKFCWDLEYDSDLNYILFFKNKEKNKQFNKEYENDEIENINEFILKNYNINFDNYKNKDDIIENDDFKLVFFSKEYLEKFITKYTVIKNLKEVGYIRKPFRFRCPKPKIEKNKTIFFVGNFEGADPKKIDKLLKNRENDYGMFFTSNTEEDNKLLYEASNDETKKLLNEFLPLKKDIIIEIDW